MRLYRNRSIGSTSEEITIGLVIVRQGNTVNYLPVGVYFNTIIKDFGSQRNLKQDFWRMEDREDTGSSGISVVPKLTRTNLNTKFKPAFLLYSAKFDCEYDMIFDCKIFTVFRWAQNPSMIWIIEELRLRKANCRGEWSWM